MSSALIMSMAAFAADAHLHQVRKELNEPYIVHPIRVANMAAQLGMDAEFIAACLGHDILEDTTVPRATIANLFPQRTVELIDAMTKWWDSSKCDPSMVAQWKVQYYNRLLKVPGASLLKVLDRTDNLHDFARMSRMAPARHKWAANYARKTREEFPSMVEAVKAEYGEAVYEKAANGFYAALTSLDSSL